MKTISKNGQITFKKGINFLQGIEFLESFFSRFLQGHCKAWKK
jgi:hypothetical protein